MKHAGTIIGVSYIAVILIVSGMALDSFIFDTLPKNGCRVYHADEYDNRWHRTVVMETTIAADIEWRSNVEHADGRITKSIAPYDGNPCDAAELDEYRTDKYRMDSYANTGGPFRISTIVFGGLAAILTIAGVALLSVRADSQSVLS